MTQENILRLHKHFTILSEGNFNERTFDIELKADKDEDSGSSHVGKMSAQRITLIRGDAKRHKEDIEKKYPHLFDKPEVKTKETKSKGKK